MNAIQLSFYLVFGGNILITWGILPGGKRVRGGNAPGWKDAVFLLVAAVLSSLVYDLLARAVLHPLGVEALGPVVFACILFGIHGLRLLAFKVLSGAQESDEGRGAVSWAFVLYATAATAGSAFDSAGQLALSGAAAAFGYLAASLFLEDIVERSELEPVPEAFQGIPVRLVSAGLVALAFSGADFSFFSSFIGK